MATTLKSLKDALDRTVMRRDFTSEYEEWINRTIRRVVDYGKFSNLRRKHATVTLGAGETSAQLPSDFRCLTNEKAPVTVTDGTGSSYPVEVVSYEVAKAREATGALPYSPGNVQVYLLPTGDGEQRLYRVGPEDGSVTFTVSYRAYPARLVQDTDTNELLLSYPDLVEAELFALAFSKTNDFQTSNEWRGQAALFAREASISDAEKHFSGRSLRMGG